MDRSLCRHLGVELEHPDLRDQETTIGQSGAANAAYAESARGPREQRITGTEEKSMSNLKPPPYLTLVRAALLAPVVMGLSACSDATEPMAMDCDYSGRPEIVFTDNDWNSAALQAAIAGKVVNLGYCYPTRALALGTVAGLEAIRAGDTHVTMEIWLPTQITAWNEAVESGAVEVVGKSLEDQWQATFIIPQYAADANPGLRTVEDLREPAHTQLFATPDSEGKARLLDCVPGWECELVNREKIETYGLGDFVHRANAASAAALAAEIESAFTRRENVLFYYWGPTTLTLKLESELGGYYVLEEEEYSVACWESGKACAYPTNEIYVGINTRLHDLAPDVVEFLRKWDFRAEIQLAAEGYLEETGAEIDDVATWFLRNNQEWKMWVEPEVADRVLAGL
ncbi:MAG: hypothetical protein F4Y74_06640 [Gemmatimonadales bacterium]|nr:hypothetical protein [Gemmatimonadales bacterium]